MLSFKTPLFIIKLFNFEYWPYYIFYLPLVPYILWLALKARSLTFFTAVNPSIEMGGIVGESKMEILKLVDSQYLPKTVFIEVNNSFSEIEELILNAGLTYPIICKPNVGERGNSVEKIISSSELLDYITNHKEEMLVQEFIDYSIELGIMYYRFPDGSKSAVSSVVRKGFLEVIGDGKHTIEELLNENTRARFVLNDLLTKLGLYSKHILKEGEKFYPQPIGNHCKGTMFINDNQLINSDLKRVFDEIAFSMKDFYYGRFDLKVKSIDDLYLGKNIKIMEVNGLTSEPGHIYDPKMNLIHAYKDVLHHFKMIYQIAMMNHRRGVEFTPFKEFRKLMSNYYSA